jgi:uncharacterized repeat protein (TIGR01451 family)
MSNKTLVERHIALAVFLGVGIALLFYALMGLNAVQARVTTRPLEEPQVPRSIGFTPIAGLPLTINVARDGSYQIIHTNSNPSSPGQVYWTLEDEADSGIFVHAKSNGVNYVIGPDFLNHFVSAANLVNLWSDVSQSAVSGTGTLADPWMVETSVVHAASGVTMTTQTSYVNGRNYFNIDWEICLPQPGSLSTFLAADYTLQGKLEGYGFYDNVSGSVGGYNQQKDWYQIFTPITPASHYFEGISQEMWDRIGQAGLPGVGFNDTVNSNLVDNGAGLQWDASVSGCATFHAYWSFGVVPPQAPTPDLALSMVADPDPVPVGDQLTYNFRIDNVGTASASGVILSDTLPSSLTFVSVTPGSPTCTRSGRLVTCNVGSLSPGASFTANTVVRTSSAGILKNTAVVRSNEIDSDPANNVAVQMTKVGAPLESVTLSGPASGEVGAKLTFTANVAPLTATLPITYTWQASGLPLLTHSGAISDMATFTWETPGVKNVSVTASNSLGPVTSQKSVTVSGGAFLVHIPLAQRAP